jgi:hypothetical protein
MELSHENEFSIVLKIEKTVEHAKLVLVRYDVNGFVTRQ